MLLDVKAMATPYLSVEKLREAAGRAASAVLPDEAAETLPVVTRTEHHGLSVLIMFFKMSGRPPAPPTVSPPTHAVWLDPRTGKVQRFRACKPEDLGLTEPLPKVPGAGEGIMDGMEKFLERRDRFFELSPLVWAAFESDVVTLDEDMRETVAEYYALFLQIVIPEVAPFYTGGAADFFAWIATVLTTAP